MSAPSPSTLVHALAALPRDEARGFRFIGADGAERFHSYAALAAEAERRAAFLQKRLTLQKGERMALVIPDGEAFVLSMLGAIVAGVVPVPIFPRPAFKNADHYREVVAHIVAASGAKHLLTSQAARQAAGLDALCAPGTGGPALQGIHDVETFFAGAAPAFTPPTLTAADLCFLQFTSGSTSMPKGVQVTHANLVANATAFLGPHGLCRRDDDLGVSWLPLYHDMGLIGFVLGTLICDIPVVLLPTERFARMPRLWLETISRYRGTITYAPNFAYELVTKRSRDKDLAALDLRCLRIAGCGAEPVRARTLRAFADRFAAAGLRPEVLLPCYGLAEHTLAATFPPLERGLAVDTVDSAALAQGWATPSTDRAASATAPHRSEIVGCGQAFPGHEVAILDADGSPCAERQVGEIVLSGPSVTPGYFQNPAASAASFRDGRLHTGDLGYKIGNELFVCGRIKDLIVVRGANIHPQDIEWTAGDVDGVRRGNVVAFSTITGGEERVVVLAEATAAAAHDVAQAVRAAIIQNHGIEPDHIGIVALGALPKTSSGKAQRRKTKALFEAGQLPEHPQQPAPATAESNR
ncbi:MAG: fatty acyl-AMP ligase [Polyangiales bacterium]